MKIRVKKLHDETEFSALTRLVDTFALLMQNRLHQKAAAGYSGWDRVAASSADRIYFDTLQKNVIDGDWLDVANLAAILWNKGYKPAEALAVTEPGPEADRTYDEKPVALSAGTAKKHRDIKYHQSAGDVADLVIALIAPYKNGHTYHLPEVVFNDFLKLIFIQSFLHIWPPV